MNSFEAKYWKIFGEGKIQCELCPRECILSEDQHGFCYSREVKSGKMFLTSYGRTSGFAIDPIEKKPLYHFLPGSEILSFGTIGCNLACSFCQNWEISHVTGRERLLENTSPAKIAELAKGRRISSVAFTYNEPVIFHEFAVDTALECRKRGIHTVAVTAGYMNEKPRIEFYNVMSAANVDLKSFSNEFYKKYCSATLQPVLDTLIYIKKRTKVWLEITNLLIPGLNDSDKELDAMTSWIAEELDCNVPLHFTAFHPAGNMHDRERTPIETLIRARDIGMKNGLRYVYTGNVHDSKGSSTICHKCGKELIVRDGFNIIKNSLNEDGACSVCGTLCAGFFAAKK